MSLVLLIDFLILHALTSEQFYTKTGKCKFGVTCKFHHPKDIVIPLSGQEYGSGHSEAVKNDTTRDFTTVNPTFTPALLHNSKGLPVRPVMYI